MAKQQAVVSGLTVRATFQPSRTGKLSLAQAYEWLLPIRHASVRSIRQGEPRKEGTDDQKASSNLRASEFRKTG